MKVLAQCPVCNVVHKLEMSFELAERYIMQPEVKRQRNCEQCDADSRCKVQAPPDSPWFTLAKDDGGTLSLGVQ